MMLSLWMEGLWHIFWLLGTSASVCFGLLQMRKHFVSQLWPLGHWTAQNETVIYLWPEKYREKRICLSSLMFRALVAILDIETGVLICNIMSNDLPETVSGGVTGTHLGWLHWTIEFLPLFFASGNICVFLFSANHLIRRGWLVFFQQLKAWQSSGLPTAEKTWIQPW